MSPFGDCTADSYKACLSRPAYPDGSALSMISCSIVHHTLQYYRGALQLIRHHRLTWTFEKVILAIFTPRIVTTSILLSLLAH